MWGRYNLTRIFLSHISAEKNESFHLPPRAATSKPPSGHAWPLGCQWRRSNCLPCAPCGTSRCLFQLCGVYIQSILSYLLCVLCHLCFYIYMCYCYYTNFTSLNKLSEFFQIKTCFFSNDSKLLCKTPTSKASRLCFIDLSWRVFTICT